MKLTLQKNLKYKKEPIYKTRTLIKYFSLDSTVTSNGTLLLTFEEITLQERFCSGKERANNKGSKRTLNVNFVDKQEVFGTIILNANRSTKMN